MSHTVRKGCFISILINIACLIFILKIKGSDSPQQTNSYSTPSVDSYAPQSVAYKPLEEIPASQYYFIVIKVNEPYKVDESKDIPEILLGLQEYTSNVEQVRQGISDKEEKQLKLSFFKEILYDEISPNLNNYKNYAKLVNIDPESVDVEFVSTDIHFFNTFSEATEAHERYLNPNKLNYDVQ